MPEPDCFLRYRISASYGILRRENATYMYWLQAAARRGFKMVLFTEQSKHLCRRYLRCTECPSTWKWCNSGAAVLTADRVEWTRFVTNTDGPLAWQWSWDQRISLCNHLCNSKAVFQDGCKCSIELFYPCLSCFFATYCYVPDVKLSCQIFMLNVTIINTFN